MFDFSKDVPDLSCLVAGNEDAYFENVHNYKDVLKNKRAEEDILSFFKGLLEEKYPDLPLFKAWERYKKDFLSK